jgi:glycosyltransferase involved in cell wall biosynthesis
MKKVLVVLPAYNAEKTLEKTFLEIPHDFVDDVLLVDDASHDGTVALAERLGIRLIVHERNRGYGGNQKTCYAYALGNQADIVVMLHPDYQYDPGRIPDLVEPILKDEADVVFGSRLLGGGALGGGMPLYKYVSNRFLTCIENLAFGHRLSDYHTGFRAYSAKVLEAIPFRQNSNGFLFDTEVIAQGIYAGFRFVEIPVQARYTEDSSSVGFLASVWYGLGTLATVCQYLLQKLGLCTFSLFGRRV